MILIIFNICSSGKAVVEERSSPEKARLLANAKAIVKHGWKPSHFMIDKSLAEKSAIHKGIYFHFYGITTNNSQSIVVFRDVIIRVCQFHIIQAIRRWDYDIGAGRSNKTARKTGKRPKYQKSLPEEALVEILALFRSTQRCRDTETHPWSEAQTTFEDRLLSICENHGVRSSVTSLTLYFRDNWWCNEWRSAYICIL
jgi:hypothetical protein